MTTPTTLQEQAIPVIADDLASTTDKAAQVRSHQYASTSIFVRN